MSWTADHYVPLQAHGGWVSSVIHSYLKYTPKASITIPKKWKPKNVFDLGVKSDKRSSYDAFMGRLELIQEPISQCVHYLGKPEGE